MEKTIGLDSVGNVIGTGKNKIGDDIRSNQVKRLGYIKCLNVR